MARVADFDRRLVAAIRHHQTLPFGWGSSDCVRVWVDCVSAITGRDPIAGLPSWSDPRTAVLALRATGHPSVTAFVASLFPEIDPANLRRGDLALAERDPQPLVSPAVVLGPEMINRNEQRWLVLPTTAAVRAFRVD